MSNYSDSQFSDDPNSSWNKVFTYIKPGSTVLDVGCSSGTMGKILQKEKQCVVDGIELDKGDFEAAKKNLRNTYNLNTETDDLSELKEQYDYIYFGDVIEHLFWPVATLKRIRPLLKPDGQVVFSIPNMAHLSVRLMLLAGDFSYGETGLLDKTHLHFYTVKEVERIFGEAGYAIAYFDPVLKDFPEELVDKELKKVGLKSTREFLQFTRSTEASIYQIVGAAAPLPAGKKPKKVPLEVSSPVDIFQKLLKQTEAYYEQQLADRAEHVAKLEKYSRDNIKLYEEALAAMKSKDEQIERLERTLLNRISSKIHRRG